MAISRRGIVLSEQRKQSADQLRSYCEADLRLCFRIAKNPVFSRCGSLDLRLCEKTKAQISFAVTLQLFSTFVFVRRIVQFLFLLKLKFQASSHLQFVSDLVGNPEIENTGFPALQLTSFCAVQNYQHRYFVQC